MKKLLIAFSLFLAMSFTANSVKAQISDPDVNVAVGNLISIQGVDVNVILQNIDVDVNDVIDVTNVLNNNDISILSNILNNLTIDNVLNNFLREAEIIKGNQVVVGVVLDVLGNVDQVLVANKKKLGLK